LIVTLGVWHRIEVCSKTSSTSTSQDGVVRWWLDGAVAGDYRTVNYPAGSVFSDYHISPTWGGVDTLSKTENDYLRFDHAYLSRGPGGPGSSGGCATGTTPPQIPGTPANLIITFLDSIKWLAGPPAYALGFEVSDAEDIIGGVLYILWIGLLLGAVSIAMGAAWDHRRRR
jgi:hypothetical protein